jgi:hypothetical protein
MEVERRDIDVISSRSDQLENRANGAGESDAEEYRHQGGLEIADVTRMSELPSGTIRLARNYPELQSCKRQRREAK